jgi:hypothetical protein
MEKKEERKIHLCLSFSFFFSPLFLFLSFALALQGRLFVKRLHALSKHHKVFAFILQAMSKRQERSTDTAQKLKCVPLAWTHAS